MIKRIVFLSVVIGILSCNKLEKQPALKHNDLDTVHKQLIAQPQPIIDTTYSKVFTVNGILCQWHNVIEIDNSPEFVNLHQRKLINVKTGLVILKANEDVLRRNALEYVSKVDLNQDGYDDFQIYNHGHTGNGSDFDDGYIFNPKIKKFDLVEAFSGRMVKYNPEKRRISSIDNVGANREAFYYSNLKKNSLETEFTERIDIDSILTYQKMISDQVVKTKIIRGKEFEQILEKLYEPSGTTFLLERK